MDIALVVLPDDAELEDTLGDLDDVECTLVLGVGFEEWLEGDGELLERLRNDSSAVSRQCYTPPRHTCSNSGSVGWTMVIVDIRLGVRMRRRGSGGRGGDVSSTTEQQLGLPLSPFIRFAYLWTSKRLQIIPVDRIDSAVV